MCYTFVMQVRGCRQEDSYTCSREASDKKVAAAEAKAEFRRALKSDGITCCAEDITILVVFEGRPKVAGWGWQTGLWC